MVYIAINLETETFSAYDDKNRFITYPFGSYKEDWTLADIVADFLDDDDDDD